MAHELLSSPAVRRESRLPEASHRTLRRRALLVGAGVLASGLLASSRALAAPENTTFDAPMGSANVRVVTLREALAYAKDHQPERRAALARLAAAGLEAEISRADWLPKVGATAQLLMATANNTTASYVGSAGVILPRIGGERVVTGGDVKPYPSTFVAIGLNQELFDFGRIAASSAIGDARQEVARHRLDVVTLKVAYDVQEAYFALFAAHGVVRAAGGALERALAHRELARAGISLGLRPPVELSRAEAELASVENGHLRAEGGLIVAQEALAAAVGAPDVQLDVTKDPPAPAEMPSLDEGLRLAQIHDPALLAAIAELRTDEARTRALAASTRPDLSFTATLSARAGGAPPSGNGEPATHSGWLPEVPNWDLGVVLGWPLFDGVVRAKVRAQAATEAVRRDEVDALRYRGAVEVRQAYVAVEIARRTLPGLARAVATAENNYREAESRFRAGLGTGVDLADAEALLVNSELQLTQGQFELARARSAFGRTIAEGLP